MIPAPALDRDGDFSYLCTGRHKMTQTQSRQATVIAFANHKGGVAKTTTTLSVGFSLARRGNRVLLVDLDAQSNLTFSLIKEDAEYDSIYNAINKGEEGLPIINVKENLDLVPSSLNLAQLEISLTGMMEREYIIADKIRPYLEEYDYIVLDCPPSLGIFTVNALVAADYVLIPMTAEVLPFKGLSSLVVLINQISERMNTRLSVLGILLTRYKGKSNLTKKIEDAISQIYGPLLLKAHVRETVRAAEAPITRLALLEYAPNSTAAKDYESVVDELLERLGKQA